MKLYVGNLNYGATEETLRELFGPYGEVASASIVMDRETGRSKGFGFVEFANDQDAKVAIENLDGKQVGGRALKVNEARPRSESGSGGARGSREHRGGGGGGGGGGRWR